MSLVSHSRAACVKSFLSLCLNWRARRALSWHGVTSAPHTPGRTLTHWSLSRDGGEALSHRNSITWQWSETSVPTNIFFFCLFWLLHPLWGHGKGAPGGAHPWVSCWGRCPSMFCPHWGLLSSVPTPNQHLTAQKSPTDSKWTRTCGTGGPLGCQEGSFYWLRLVWTTGVWKCRPLKCESVQRQTDFNCVSNV